MQGTSTYWYVLSVRTGAEEKLIKLLKDDVSGSFKPFIPRKVCVLRRQGKISLFEKICFPGYLFIESDKPAPEFLSYAYTIVDKLNDAYRFLCYGSRYDAAMREDERNALNALLSSNHCINISTGFKAGDSIRIVSGALVGSESKIKRINKNRKYAIISIDMFNTEIEVSVCLDMVEKV